ncbi:MAG TPA: hypothetical protein VNM90_30570 [Haliangium sp.]|nr:hypothetical protein [Haliangium sp.]
MNAARGCVGKSEVQSLWRHRGAAPQGAPEITKDVVPSPQTRARRTRTAAAASAPAISEMYPHEVPEIQDPGGDGPEIQGNPDPDGPEPEVPGPEVPEPEVPEPEVPEHPATDSSN